MGSDQRRRGRWWLLLLLLAMTFIGVVVPAGLTAARILAREQAEEADRDEQALDRAFTAEAAQGAAGSSAQTRAPGDRQWTTAWPSAPGWDGHRPGHDASGDSFASRNGPGSRGIVEDPNWANEAGGGRAFGSQPGDSATGGAGDRTAGDGDHVAKHAAGQPMLSGQPGRATPVAPPQSGSVRVDWDYRLGSQTFHCTTTLDIGAGGPDDLRRLATVTTRDQAGNLLVSYSGTAFLDADGALHVDARNAPVSGPWAANWSPDSFAVDQYGQTRTLDDFNRGGGGWATPAGS
jgi:hypothetical protein